MDRVLIDGPMVALSRGACLEFLDRVERASVPLSTLAQMADAPVVRAVMDNLDCLREAIPARFDDALSDPACGICGVDVPDNLRESRALDAVCGGVISSAINMLIMRPVVDQKNKTPFTLHNASTRNEGMLREAGLKFFSPGEKMGFHTDGLLVGESVHIPNYVSIYNLQIAYRRLGNFYWLPFHKWVAIEDFAAVLGVGTEFKFELTPIIYDISDQLEVNKAKAVTAPIFHKADDGRLLVFFNGDVVGVTGPLDWASLEGVISRLRRSLLENAMRIAIPIKNRRLFVMNNQLGFHARDIFEEPIDGAKYTRSYLRTVSHESVSVNRSN